jgi:hypothetical protein
VPVDLQLVADVFEEQVARPTASDRGADVAMER